MKKRWWYYLSVFALLLAACNAGENTPGNGEPNPAFEPLDPTSPLATMGTTVTEEPDAPEPELAEMLSSLEPVVINAPVLASTLMELPLGSLDGVVGDTTGLVIDGFTGRLLYLQVETVGPTPNRALLLPWGAFQIVALPPKEEHKGVEPALLVWLTVKHQAAIDSPGFDPVDLQDLEDLPADWDQPFVRYWFTVLPDLPVTSSPSSDPSQEVQSRSGDAPGLIYVQEGPLLGIDLDVRSPENQVLGEIQDFVVDNDGRVAFAILDPHTLMDLGEGMAPVPWRALVWDPDMRVFTLDISHDILKQAPHLDPADLPDMTVPGWEEDWRKFWSNQAVSATEAIPEETIQVMGAAVRTGQIAGQPLMSGEGDGLGRLVDWMVELSGQAEFALVEWHGQVVAVPWRALDWQQEEEGAEGIVFRHDPSIFEAAPVFESIAALYDSADWYNQAVRYWSDYIDVAQAQASLDPESSLEWVRAGQLVEAPVVDIEGQALGAVEEIILGENSQVIYLVVQSGGLFRPVPWLNFEVNLQSGQVTYLDDVVRLADAPGFPTLDALPTGDLEWDAGIRQYWGMK